MNDLFGMLFWAIVFYTVNAFVNFKFMDMTMTPVTIAMLNTVFRLATVIILFPFIRWIEKLVFALVKDDEEDKEDQEDFDLLEERFLRYPALAIGQSHTAMNGMAKKAKKNIVRAMELLDNYSEERYAKVHEKENLIDKYEDKLGTYLMQLTGREMTESQSKQVSILLHSVNDIERLGDHAVNISKSANELYEKKFSFSDEANYEISVLGGAVREILDLTVKTFTDYDVETALMVEPLRELINVLCNELKSRHISRLKNGKCELKQGFAFNNLLTDFERIAAHCSNIAIAVLECESDDFDTHEYQKSIREMNNGLYTELFESYELKYNINNYKKKKKNK
jgi:phosphate:Na+ symporter